MRILPQFNAQPIGSRSGQIRTYQTWPDVKRAIAQFKRLRLLEKTAINYMVPYLDLAGPSLMISENVDWVNRIRLTCVYIVGGYACH